MVITAGVDKLLERTNSSCLASDLHNYLLADSEFMRIFSAYWKGFKQLQHKHGPDKSILKGSELNGVTVASGHIPNHVRVDCSLFHYPSVKKVGVFCYLTDRYKAANFTSGSNKQQKDLFWTHSEYFTALFCLSTVTFQLWAACRKSQDTEEHACYKTA